MLKIAITGHTSGIGKHLFEKVGYKGYSSSTGFDLTTDDAIERMITDASDVDILVNNAENGENIKLKVMQHVWDKWRWEDKILINMGSYKTMQAELMPGIKESEGYKQTIEQQNFWNEIAPLESKLAVGLIELGPIGTQRTFDKGMKNYTSIDDVCKSILDMADILTRNQRMVTQILCKGLYK